MTGVGGVEQLELGPTAGLIYYIIKIVWHRGAVPSRQTRVLELAVAQASRMPSAGCYPK